MLSDVKLAVRALLRQPGFTAPAVLIVALGAGANGTVFSVVRAVLIEPLPYARPDALAAIWPGSFVSNADLDFLRTRCRSFTQVGLASPGWTMSLLGAGEPRRVTATKTSANLFRLLGARPLRGRVFRDDEDQPANARVAILSHRLWQAQFHGDPAAVGQVVTLEGAPHQIVGVMDPAFELLGRDAELWIPLPFDPTSNWKATFSQAVTRLRPGVTLDAAARELRSLVPAWQHDLGYENDWRRGETPIAFLADLVVGDVRRPLMVLLAAVGLVLVLCAANVGTLLLGRHVARRREMTVRRALGASRWRLFRQTAAESLVLAVAGAAAGALASYAALPVLVRMLPPEVPRLAAIRVDALVLGTVLAVSACSVFAFGALPSFLAVRPDLQRFLRLGAQSDTRAGRRTLHVLVVGQVALSLVLGIGAALMVRSLVALENVRPGFESDHVLTLKLQPSPGRSRNLARAVAYHDELLARISSVPGVLRVGAVNHLPLSGYNWVSTVQLDERPLPPGVSPPTVGWRMIHGPYFETMRIPVLAGRVFRDSDTTASPAAAAARDRNPPGAGCHAELGGRAGGGPRGGVRGRGAGRRPSRRSGCGRRAAWHALRHRPARRGDRDVALRARERYDDRRDTRSRLASLARGPGDHVAVRVKRRERTVWRIRRTA